ncbi:AraC family transcriptional regulator [Burkholderia pseudomallei]|nr:helix-turn-helix domain protein [Burkholderia pseudomallei MSHR733]MBD2916632.1 AraC family transcriptional regulator [Burkholderia pseudomallei]MBD2997568.1 AraC family transcriptional regulator [Burkholderia pseudomallei]OMR36271.1 AraC family transcriptional regulator [Burkholderia pseudomallei]OMR55852.1 AraC family transcriptional regulator [Burkholderia pseudomallei]
MKHEEKKGTVSIELVESSLALSRRRGVDDASLLAQAGIAGALLAQPNARVSARQYGALWNAIARALDDEFFGQDSHPMRCGSFIAMSQAALTARNGLRALARAVNFMHCVLDDLHAQLDASAERVRLRFVHRNSANPPEMFAYATYFVIVYGLTCWLIGRRIPLLHASFRCGEPRAVHEYRLMFCDDMRFGEPDSYVDFDPAFAALPIVQTAQTLKPFLRDAPASFIVKYRNPHALGERVRAALRALPPAAWPTARALAARLHVAEATLRRKLKQEGHSYQSIKDALRRDLACEALADPARTVADVAAATGFAEPSAFYRAFRKWRGMSPADYRDAALAARAAASRFRRKPPTL